MMTGLKPAPTSDPRDKSSSAGRTSSSADGIARINAEEHEVLLEYFGIAGANGTRLGRYVRIGTGSPGTPCGARFNTRLAKQGDRRFIGP